MAQAERNPSDNAPNQSDPIKRFHAEYAEAIADVAVSADLTKQAGWQSLYAQHREADRKTRRGIAGSARILADKVEDFGWSEDDEKAIKELAKQSAERRDTNAAFERECVDRVLEPLRWCDRVIETFRNQAARDESAAPLVHIGLVELMASAIKSVRKATFDSETGVVSIDTP